MKKILAMIFFLAAGPLDITGVLSVHAQAQNHTIKGNVGAATVVLSWTDTTAKTITITGNGDYTITVSPSWSGTITPSKTGFTFSPANRTYTNVTTNQNNQNFTQTAITYLISGNAGTNAASLAYNDGGPKTATSNAGGDYSFSVPYNWSGTVTPSKAGYIFTPGARTYTNVLANQSSQDFTVVRFFTIAGDAGGTGITISWMDTTAKSITAATDGRYSIAVSDGWTGTVTPTKTGFSYTPVNRSYTNVTANQTNQNFAETAITYTIAGNTGVGAVKLAYTDGTAKTVNSAANGNYSFTVSYNWSGTVTPSKTGFAFTPVNRSYSNVLANQTSQDYAASAVTFSISGNTGIGGVTLAWTDTTAKTAISDGSGNYAIVVSYSFDGDVTPTLTGYDFTPVKITYSNVLANKIDQNYVAAPAHRTISGKGGRNGVVISWFDTTAKSVIGTGAGGDYTFDVSYGWSGTVTPSLTGYTFTPVNRSYVNVVTDKKNQDFTDAAGFTIAGNAGAPGVLLSWTDGIAKTDTADGTGAYIITVVNHWAGTVTPSLTGYTFAPVNRVYTARTRDTTGQDFVATPFIAANVKVYLTGPFNAGVMTTSLNSLGLIPLSSASAYPVATYGGAAKIVSSIPSASIVDWVLVELRSGTDSASHVALQAAFVKSDGAVVDADGVSALTFSGIAHGSYYVVVRHRNHLPLMSASPVAFNGTATSYDFTTGQTQAFGTNPMFALAGGVFGMKAGDVDRNGSVQFTGTGSDRRAILMTVGTFDPTIPVSGYLDTDANLDGQAQFTGTGSDRRVILDTVGTFDPTIPVVSQVPH